MEELMINWGYVILLFILGFFTYKRKALDLLGSLFMVIMGIVIIFSAGVNWLLLLILFLILSLIATRYAKRYKTFLGEFEGQRTTKNVISNGIVAFMMAAFGGYYLPFVGGFIGAISTATADTLASEIGVTTTPRLITTFKKVEPGTDGAVSVLGTAAGIGGAAIIGIAAYLLGIVSNPFSGLIVAIVSGTIGCFMDSFLGATFERKEMLTNEHVNLIATITGAIVGIILI
ncbi:MAG: TIGR00297 family protein [Methanobrevibacter sp.]|uniref:TIGR00297 family protein n=1 Tax=Methanobrevibacter sp. TaxID=66852 RepID=UPI0026DF3A86|nr:TIGR00297 family protein [Methanobrevibacter sp.]MDO5848481.1 TIGR00297 family protein [Methanobrevibacter sp.]